MLELRNKKIAILGLGLENLALIKYLLKHKVKCEITICDARKDVKIKHPWIPAFAGMTKKRVRMIKISWQLGKEYDKNLDKFDILFRSPGWPLNELKSRKLKVESLNSPMRLFFELCPTKNIIGVTGTKGKGTTVSLIYEILKLAGKKVWLGGNIGVAPFEFMDKIKKTDWVVLELSSFQLEDMTVSPHIAVITNLYPEHLAPADPNNPNFHHSFRKYLNAKINIARWQKSGDYLISNDKFPMTKKIPNLKSKIVYFKKSELPSKLIGEHNKENIAAAVKAAKIVGIKPEVIKKAVVNFKGLKHRLELAGERQGVKYYDDSFATTPESAIIALKAFAQPVIILLGGADKGSNFKVLALEAKRRCKFVVLLNGRATPGIKKELLKAKFDKNKMKLANNMKEAIAIARAESEFGDVVLLSTACASFGMFKNYKERGDLFKKQVNNLK
ncbi:MAG: UDP-N-acetylmuramoyl-L-alanine--D-glutamate ligase [Patescibacteria group bacterium]|nr:UDP-N-acetylmuramoyl-L-alanine--D-glutamate ligase [Patescibacteria group bacterium]